MRRAARRRRPELNLPEETQPSPAGPHETRKIVTVVFTDIAESTSPRRPSIPSVCAASWSGTSTRCLTRWNGAAACRSSSATPFSQYSGSPTSTRTTRYAPFAAALEVAGALDLLNEELERDWGVRIQTRTGVNTGEVVAANGSPGRSFVTGRAVNVAARLEQTAPSARS